MVAASALDARPETQAGRVIEQRPAAAASGPLARASDHAELAVRELGRRSLPGTIAYIAALLFTEVKLAALPGFPALRILVVFASLLVLRLAGFVAVTRGRGSLRQRWVLIALGSIGIHLAWGVLIVAVHLYTGTGELSIVMTFLMGGVATGGVSAFAPSRWLHCTCLSMLVLPMIAIALAGLAPTAFAITQSMFFGFMLVLGKDAHREFWQSIHRQEQLRGHAESAQLAAIAADATARQLRTEIEHRAAVELELRQAQKLEAIGRLAAGIAHEINTPIQFVSDSCRFLGDGIQALGATLDAYRGLVAGLAGATVDPAHADAVARGIDRDHDVAYLTSNLPEALARALDGLDRVAKIVGATKEFSYPYLKEKSLADVNKAIRSTLVIAHNETKYVAAVHAELGELPMVLCHCGELNQVVLNLIVNAAHAIGDVVRQTGVLGEIRIKTWAAGDLVKISISDTGSGIAPEILDKIFEPFFTTKPIGGGSGQGLAIARSVVVDKHGGTIEVQSALGIGTTFTIALPIGGAPAAA
jgi:signal transduction histidine kinase